MAVIKKEKAFEPHPAVSDPIRAVLVDVTPFEDKDTQYGRKKQCCLVFETEMQREDGTGRWTHWEHGYTESIHEKSNLGKDARKILGRDDLGDEFDTEELIGKPVKLIIEHKKDGDRVFANVVHLAQDKGGDPLKPSGTYIRKQDKVKTDAGTSYNKAGGAAPKDEPKRSSEDSWKDCKVHVGTFAGHVLSDVPIDGVQKLIDKWIPTTQVAGYKATADDTRLLNALASFQVFLESQTPKDDF